MEKFSKEQEESIEQKIELYSSLLEKDLLHEEVMRRIKKIENKIIKKRLKWYEEHKDELNYLKMDIHDLHKAFIMVFGHQMDIPHKDIGTMPVYYDEQGIFMIYIQARNFCPYLEAFKRMNLTPKNSIKLCELTLEQPCQVLINKINPKIRFSRNYDKIRPITDYCDERLVVVDYSISEKIDALEEKGESEESIFGLIIGTPENFYFKKQIHDL